MFEYFKHDAPFIQTRSNVIIYSKVIHDDPQHVRRVFNQKEQTWAVLRNRDGQW